MRVRERMERYYPEAQWTEKAGEHRGVVHAPAGLVSVTMWDYRTKGRTDQNVYFHTIIDGVTYSRHEHREPSRRITIDGAARLARRWHRELLEEARDG